MSQLNGLKALTQDHSHKSIDRRIPPLMNMQLPKQANQEPPTARTINKYESVDKTRTNVLYNNEIAQKFTKNTKRFKYEKLRSKGTKIHSSQFTFAQTQNSISSQEEILPQRSRKSMNFDENGLPESVKRYPGVTESWKNKEHESNSESLNDIQLQQIVSQISQRNEDNQSL